jgi:CO dehydrogenase/acetyl-CoA synthase gamma subunit (corrinoid Fe-S protein)
MRAVLSSNDLVQLSFLSALLADAGIETAVLDTYTSITEGSAGAIPRRLMVGEEDYDRACRVLREAGEL